MNNFFLGVNIDHIATIRNARKTRYPDPIHFACLAEQAGADSITVHLREDRRHINERDIRLLKKMLQTKINLEIAATNEMIDIACSIKPYSCCIVPEKREELTTESGLNLLKEQNIIHKSIELLNQNDIKVSLFIDPEKKQIDSAVNLGVEYIEIHTGKYANAKIGLERLKELNKIKSSVDYASSLNLKTNVGHGLDYHNIKDIACLKNIFEFNIGHSIISRSFFVGVSEAVKSMKNAIYEARFKCQLLV